MQGFNMGRYVPPEHAGVSSANALHGRHPLGKRARPGGAVVVRFEMPFPVWCTTCQPARGETLIGQGVRFNAEKRRAGSYHSTPIYAFRMRHAPCGGTIEIRTDPANTAYVVASGGRRRDAGDGGAAESLVSGSGEVQLQTARERDAARGSAFAHLERTIEDRAALAAGRQRIGELAEAAGRRWDDPYARNRALRRAFRAGRREREAEGAAAEALRDRLSFGLDLVAASDEDARRAALVDFGTAERDAAASVDKALARPLFGGGTAAPDRIDKGGEVPRSTKKRNSRTDETPQVKKLRSKVVADKTKDILVSEKLGNTRAAKDPFLEGWSKEPTKPPGLLPGLKRKRSAVETAVANEDSPPPPPAKSTPASKNLVGYDSDSD